MHCTVLYCIHRHLPGPMSERLILMCLTPSLLPNLSAQPISKQGMTAGITIPYHTMPNTSYSMRDYSHFDGVYARATLRNVPETILMYSVDPKPVVCMLWYGITRIISINSPQSHLPFDLLFVLFGQCTMPIDRHMVSIYLCHFNWLQATKHGYLLIYAHLSNIQ